MTRAPTVGITALVIVIRPPTRTTLAAIASTSATEKVGSTPFRPVPVRGSGPAYRVEAGHGDVVPRAAAFPTFDGPAATLVTALRIVCGGSVVSTRSMLAQDETEFPFLPSSSAVMTAFNSVARIVVVGHLQHRKRLDWRTTFTRNAPNVSDALGTWK